MHLSKCSSKRCIVFFTYFFTKTEEWKLEKWKLTQLNASRCFEIATRATNKNLSISRPQFAPKVACKATIPRKSEDQNLPPQASRLIGLTTLLRFLKSAALNIYLCLLLLLLFEWVLFLRNLLPRPRARIRTPAFRRSSDGPTTESLEIPSVIAISTLGQKIWSTAKYWCQIW